MTNFAYIIMGVSGSGKSTIGKLLSEALNIIFLDGDDFHPEANINKMSEGIPLTDEDRFPWLLSINEKCKQLIKEGKSVVFACSALKESYRNILSKDSKDTTIFIFLKADKNLIFKRLSERKNHFMPTALIESQFSTLEEPKNSIEIDASLNEELLIKKIMNQLTKSTIGIVGLGVMGTSLARNFAQKGVKLSLYNRKVIGTEEEVAEKTIANFSELANAQGFEDLQLFVSSLEKPRKIILMIQAGSATDTFIEEIIPFLEKEDILIDGGNSHYLDTARRMNNLKKKSLNLIGAGVSGGEKGALNGPSIMPSGTLEAYQQIAPYLELIAAKDSKGNPCSSYIGPEGSGHYIKMVHNGIEYAEMQLIAETYAYLRYIVQKSPIEISELFKVWNSGELNSYLLEITAKLLLKKEGDNWLIDLILDKAGNKGTGNWTTISASELGVPSTVITAALFARYLSTIKETVTNITTKMESKPQDIITISAVKKAYELARIINHQQGFLLIKSASDNFNWNLNVSEIARIWTNGCIIRSTFMERLIMILKEDIDLFLNPTIKEQLSFLKPFLKEFCVSSLQHELSIPCHLAVLDYLNTLTNNYATANIIQAQRDFFGAHKYQKTGSPSDEFYHTVWE